MRPEIAYPAGDTVFRGYSKMAILVQKVNVMEIQPPRVGESVPALVRGEVYLDLESLPKHARREWSTIRVDDVIFLLSVKLEDPKNGAKNRVESDGGARAVGVRWVRTAEISHILDENGRVMRQANDDLDGRYLVPRKRTLGIRLDARQWKEDNEASVSGKMEDVYDSINIVVRRRADVLPSQQTFVSRLFGLWVLMVDQQLQEHLAIDPGFDTIKRRCTVLVRKRLPWIR
jgi:intron-binding protein aquarius